MLGLRMSTIADLFRPLRRFAFYSFLYMHLVVFLISNSDELTPKSSSTSTGYTILYWTCPLIVVFMLSRLIRDVSYELTAYYEVILEGLWVWGFITFDIGVSINLLIKNSEPRGSPPYNGSICVVAFLLISGIVGILYHILLTWLAVYIELHSASLITFVDVRQIPSCIKHIEAYRSGRRDFGLPHPATSKRAKQQPQQPSAFRPGQWRMPDTQRPITDPPKRSASLSSGGSHKALLTSNAPPLIRVSPATSLSESTRKSTKTPRNSASTYPSVYSPQRESAHLPSFSPSMQSEGLQPQMTGDSDWRRSATTVWSQESAADNHRSFVPPMPVFPQRWKALVEQKERELQAQEDPLDISPFEDTMPQDPEDVEAPQFDASPTQNSQLEPTLHSSPRQMSSGEGLKDDGPPPLPPKDPNRRRARSDASTAGSLTTTHTPIGSPPRPPSPAVIFNQA
jgi:hypothetical protein